MNETKLKIIEVMHNLSRPGAKALVGFLEISDFFTAPASGGTNGEKHLCEAGGLALHSLNVYTALNSMAPKYLPGVEHDSIVVCGLLHDLCKANFYKNDFRNVKNDRGQWERVPYFAIDDQDPLGHGEKSVIIAQRFISLSQDEALAIRWHMGAWDAQSYGQQQALNAAMRKCRLLRALIIADQVAAYFMEAR